MSKINITITGVGAELVLGTYLPNDNLIFSNWEEFFHYNDLLHHAQLLVEHISEIEITKDGAPVYKGQIPEKAIVAEKSFSPVFEEGALYLRTECVEQCVYSCEFEADAIDLSKLKLESQDYDLIFKVGKSFLAHVSYDGQPLSLEWVSGKPIANICLLCKFENGFLVPFYDAVNKVVNKL